MPVSRMMAVRAVPGGLQSFDQLKARELYAPAAPARRGRCVSTPWRASTDRSDAATDAAATARRRVGRCGTTRNRRCRAQFLLHGLAQIAHEMKAIGDLTRLRRAAAHAVGIRAVAIAADDPNARDAPPSQAATASAVRTARTSTTRRRSKSTRDRPEMLLALSARPSHRCRRREALVGAERTARRV